MNKPSKFFIPLFLLSIFVFQGQIAFSQEKEKGIKISETETIAKVSETDSMVGYWRHPNRAVWLHITADQKAFQCRIGKDEMVYKAFGTLTNGKISWDVFWGTDKVSIKNGLVSLKGLENFSLIPVAEISDDNCFSPLTLPDLDLSYGPGRGVGIGDGEGYGIGVGRGTGSSGGMGSGNGSGSGDGVGMGSGNGNDDATTDNPTSSPSTGETRGLQILSKPSPAYTEIARQNGVQGVVQLRVTFLANGTIGSISIVKGLADGLTEQAIAAARRMTFKPAMKDGQPYTVTKLVEFNFTIY